MLNNQNNEYQSCCYRIDKQFAMFIIGVVVVLSTIALSIYKLIVEKSCESASPYYSLLSSTCGVATGVVFSSISNKKLPQILRHEHVASI